MKPPRRIWAIACKKSGFVWGVGVTRQLAWENAKIGPDFADAVCYERLTLKRKVRRKVKR